MHSDRDVDDTAGVAPPIHAATSYDRSDQDGLVYRRSEHPTTDRLEAVLGADIKVPTITGSSITVRIPAGTPSGKVLRVRGRGVKTQTETGDLLVTVMVHVPTDPSADERALIESLAEVTDPAPRADMGV